MLNDYSNNEENADNNNSNQYQKVEEHLPFDDKENSIINPETNFENNENILNNEDFLYSFLLEYLGKKFLIFQKQIEKLKIKKRTYKTLFLLGLANLLGYYGKYEFALIFESYRANQIKNKIKKNETTYDNYTDGLQFNIGNYSYSNNSDKNETNINNTIHDIDKNVYFYISLVYISCILISIILIYSLMICFFFKKKEKEKNNEIEKSESCKCDCCAWKIVCEICGCIIYCERVILDEKETIKNKRCYELCC